MKPYRKFRLFQIRWNEPMGRPECPYLFRWVLIVWQYAIRLHKWIRSDDKRYYHDHPWPFILIVLKGKYEDVSIHGNYLITETLVAGSIRYRSAEHRHYVKVIKSPTWSLVLTGPPIKHWGFWVKNRMIRPLRYFHKYGHPPCEEP